MAMTDDDEPREYASSPCYQHEFDDRSAVLPQDVAPRLNELLEGERAGAMGVLDDLLPTIGDPALHEDLEDMRDTHVRNIEICAKYLES